MNIAATVIICFLFLVRMYRILDEGEHPGPDLVAGIIIAALYTCIVWAIWT